MAKAQKLGRDATACLNAAEAAIHAIHAPMGPFNSKPPTRHSPHSNSDAGEAGLGSLDAEQRSFLAAVERTRIDVAKLMAALSRCATAAEKAWAVVCRDKIFAGLDAANAQNHAPGPNHSTEGAGLAESLLRDMPELDDD